MSASFPLARIASILLSLVAARAVAACGSSSSSTTASSSGFSLAAGCRPRSAGDQTVRTSTHVFLLHVGPEESMVMLHICDRATGSVLTRAMPSITLTPRRGGRPERVPVMVMERVNAGVGDLHYGNNVPMHPGARYLVVVRLGNDRAAFTYRLPRRG